MAGPAAAVESDVQSWRGTRAAQPWGAEDRMRLQWRGVWS